VAIMVTCSQCQQTLSVKEEYAGKRGKCPKCQAIVPIPAMVSNRTIAAPPATAMSAASLPQRPPAPHVQLPRAATPPKPAPPDQVRAAIFAGFRGPIERVPTTPLYQLGILLTALFMILLPLVYLAVIGLVGLIVWWHLTNNHVIFGAVHGGRAGLLALIVYLAPLVVGVIVIAFMFKPLFARPQQEGRRRSVTPHSDPLLFEFVERICGLVGAARPRRIDIDCNINASASFRRGWLSLLTGRDLVLTIGMPLAAGLSLQQFAGVLAHEFGHFSQGAGMRLTYIIRSINFWFLRVVYERDAWDAWLETAADGVDLRVGWIIYVARGCVWLTRKILWLLMYVGHLVAGFMLRQMEFDADKYEARVAGSETFAATARQLKLLELAWHGAKADLATFHREGRLVDNLPRLLMANLKQLPKEANDFVTKLISESKTGLFDSHPADNDRIDSARAEQAVGVFHSRLSASVLFSSFDAAGKNVTWDFYCSVFGPTVNPQSLHSTADLLARSDAEAQAAKARDRFFAESFTVLRALRLPVLQGQVTQRPSVWQEELAQARTEMESLADDYREQIKVFDRIDTRLIQSCQARSVLSTGVRLRADRFDEAFPSQTEATRICDGAASELARMASHMEDFEDAAGRRLRADLMLLFDPATAARLPEAAAWQADCRKLLPVVSLVATSHAVLMEIRNNNAMLAALLGHWEEKNQSQVLSRVTLGCAVRVRSQLSDLQRQFEALDYPFDHAAGQMSVAKFLLTTVPSPREVGAIFEAADEVLKKLMELSARALNRLCVIAEAVEADHGYQPLPAPTADASPA
jgi:Peptidase family M48